MSLKKIYNRLSVETQSEFLEAMREEIKSTEEEILYTKTNLDSWLEDVEVIQVQVEGWLKHYFSLWEEHRKLITFVKETGLLEEYNNLDK
mgnify:CR=1 FL=1